MSDSGQLIIDHAGIIAGVDFGFCALVRRPADTLVGISILDITAPGDRLECQVALAQMVKTNRQVRATKRYMRGDGTLVWAEATASLILRSDFPGCAMLQATPITIERPSHHPGRLLQTARSLRGQDSSRTNVVDSSFLPAWGAILGAYIAEAEGRLFPEGSSDLFGLASSSQLDRWTKALVSGGVFEVETRNPTPDAAKSYRLTLATQEKLERYLEEVDSELDRTVTPFRSGAFGS